MNNKWEELGVKFSNFLKKVLLNIILTDKTRDRAVAIMNEKIDIPILNEKEEADLMKLIWEAAEQAIREALEPEE